MTTFEQKARERHEEEIQSLRDRWVGKRVVLRNTPDSYTGLEPGDEGTVYAVDSAGTLHVSWDSGSSMRLIPTIDSWEEAEDQSKNMAPVKGVVPFKERGGES